jgi:acyl dehydratase
VPLAGFPNSLRFNEIQIGSAFETSASFGNDEMDQFSALSGDQSSIHSDPETAKRFGFRDRLQYGFLLAALLSRIVGVHFEHAVCASVAIDFVKPVVAGDRVDVRAEVTQVQEGLRSILLKVAMVHGRDVVVRGKLTVIFLAQGA